MISVGMGELSARKCSASPEYADRTRKLLGVGLQLSGDSSTLSAGEARYRQLVDESLRLDLLTAGRKDPTAAAAFSRVAVRIRSGLAVAADRALYGVIFRERGRVVEGEDPSGGAEKVTLRVLFRPLPQQRTRSLSELREILSVRGAAAEAALVSHVPQGDGGSVVVQVAEANYQPGGSATSLTLDQPALQSAKRQIWSQLRRTERLHNKPSTELSTHASSGDHCLNCGAMVACRKVRVDQRSWLRENGGRIEQAKRVWESTKEQMAKGINMDTIELVRQVAVAQELSARLWFAEQWRQACERALAAKVQAGESIEGVGVVHGAPDVSPALDPAQVYQRLSADGVLPANVTQEKFVATATTVSLPGLLALVADSQRVPLDKAEQILSGKSVGQMPLLRRQPKIVLSTEALQVAEDESEQIGH